MNDNRYVTVKNFPRIWTAYISSILGAIVIFEGVTDLKITLIGEGGLEVSADNRRHNNHMVLRVPFLAIYILCKRRVTTCHQNVHTIFEGVWRLLALLTGSPLGIATGLLDARPRNASRTATENLIFADGDKVKAENYGCELRIRFEDESLRTKVKDPGVWDAGEISVECWLLNDT